MSEREDENEDRHFREEMRCDHHLLWTARVFMKSVVRINVC